VAKPPADTVLDALLERHGQTYAEELGIDVAKGTPSVLFRLLVASILFSVRIGAGQAVKAARALTDAGWTTADKLAATAWRERVRVLNRHGYARYDERTASMLGGACQLLLDRYRGDLRRLRAEAGQDPRQERRLLKQVKGLGDVGVDIFFREAQVALGGAVPVPGPAGRPGRPPARPGRRPQGPGRRPEPQGVRPAGGRADPHTVGR
jgi:hypothetical protein